MQLSTAPVAAARSAVGPPQTGQIQLCMVEVFASRPGIRNIVDDVAVVFRAAKAVTAGKQQKEERKSWFHARVPVRNRRSV